MSYFLRSEYRISERSNPKLKVDVFARKRIFLVIVDFERSKLNFNKCPRGDVQKALSHRISSRVHSFQIDSEFLSSGSVRMGLWTPECYITLETIGKFFLPSYLP